jgi:hypothetical protein
MTSTLAQADGKQETTPAQADAQPGRPRVVGDGALVDPGAALPGRSIDFDPLGLWGLLPPRNGQGHR